LYFTDYVAEIEANKSMSVFYKTIFWIFLAILAFCAAIITYYRLDYLSLMLPASAVLFTIGNLWLGWEKHDTERADKYWDKRFECFRELTDTMIKINGLMPTDIDPNKEPNDNKILEIEKDFWNLENKIRLLFGGKKKTQKVEVVNDFITIRDETRIYFKLLIDWRRNQLMETSAPSIQASERSIYFENNMNYFKRDVEIKKKINNLFEECKKKIFEFLEV